MPDKTSQDQKRPVVVDLFAGAGGISLGLEAAGFDVALGIDIDSVHCATHKYNFPYGETICGDISELDFQVAEDALSEFGVNTVDVVVGGPPCQGFSQIGKRQISDSRNSLVFDYCKFIRYFKPKYFIFENVPGIARGKHKRFLDELKVEFESMDYNVEWPPRILNSADFGVAQNRDRVFILGVRNDQKPISYPSPELNIGLFKNGTSNGFHKVGVREVLEDLEAIDAFTGGDGEINPSHLDYSGRRRDFDVAKDGRFKLCHNRYYVGEEIYNHVGSNHQEKSIRRFSETNPGSTEKVSRFFRLHPDRPANTLRAGTARNRGAFTAARPIHYSKPRCITVREAARLHSFPDWFRFNRTIWHGFRQIGNSVTPLLALEIGKKILTGLQVNRDELPVYDLRSPDDSLLSLSMNQACEVFDVPEELVEKRGRDLG